MFTTCEKALINKDYNEYDGKNIWNFYKKNDEKSVITLKLDLIKLTYVFSFPLQNSKWNYRVEFETLEEAKKYIEYVVGSYL